MFSIHTDDECFYVGIERGNDNSKKSLKSHIAPYQCCPSTKEKPQARLAVLSDTKLGNSKAPSNDQTFKFENEKDQKSVGKPKGSKPKSPPKPAQSQEERKAKKEEREAKKEAAPEKKKRERDVKEKEPKDSKDKDIDKKKGKDKKEKGKNTQDDDGDGFFQLGNWW
jgi:hypothetical protein